MPAIWRSSRVSACRRGPNSHEPAVLPLTAACCRQSDEPLVQQVTAAGMVSLRSEVVRCLLRSNVPCLARPLASLAAVQDNLSALARSEFLSASALSPAHRDGTALVPVGPSSVGQFFWAWRMRRCPPVGQPPRAARPNHSFNRTRYGRHRKAGLRHMVHHLSPALRCLPPRAG